MEADTESLRRDISAQFALFKGSMQRSMAFTAAGTVLSTWGLLLTTLAVR